MACKKCLHNRDELSRSDSRLIILPDLGGFRPPIPQLDRRNSSRRWQERSPLQIVLATPCQILLGESDLIRQAHLTEVATGVSYEVCADPRLHTWLRPVLPVVPACECEFAQALPVHAIHYLGGSAK